MVEKITELLETIREKNDELKNEIENISNKNKDILEEVSKTSKWDEELLKDWFNEYWHMYPNPSSPEEWLLIVPKFIPFSVGWLDHSTKGYNVFRINQYTQWLGEMPEFLRKELQFKKPEKIFVSDGNVIFDEGKEKEVKDRYGDLISSIGKGTAKIKVGKEFNLIAKIIENGSLPFIPRPVDKLDIIPNPTNIKMEGKYIFQQHAWESFMKFGAIGLYWMTSAGKDIFSSYVLSRIKVKEGCKTLPNLYVSPNLTILEQMRKEYFPKYAPDLMKEIENGDLILSTYQGYDKIKDIKFGVTIFGESHVLPADSFSRLATIKTKYRMGQSASPFREDGRHSLIFALTGVPLGMNWQELIGLLGKKYHDINVYIFNNIEQKIKFATNLVSSNAKTLLFVDKLEIGNKLSSLLGVPFIHGATRNRIEIAKSSRVFVASRVLEMGVSIKDLEHIVEVDFFYGSRREQVQRTGRLFHSESKNAKKHDILMTKEEFDLYGKRLHGLVEKGFKINLKPMIAGSFQVKRMPVPTSGSHKNKVKSSTHSSFIDELFEEGFFVAERKLSDVYDALQRRGITKPRQFASGIFSKLNGMVRSKKIYKVKKTDAYYFVNR